MPSLPDHAALPQPPREDTSASRWIVRFVATFTALWTSLIYVVNGMSQVDTLANRTSEPDLDHALFTASNTGQTFVGVSGVWTPMPRDGGFNTTQVGTAADTVETDLMTDSVPADVLEVNGRTVFVEAWGTFAANANTKTVRLKHATKVLASASGAFNNLKWFLHGQVTRTAVDAQDVFGYGLVESNNPTGFVVDTDAADENIAQTVKVTGQNGTAVANDIVAHGFRWWVGGR